MTKKKSIKSQNGKLGEGAMDGDEFNSHIKY